MLSAILLSGGVGSRMNQSVPKQYMLLAGKPVIMHTIERLDAIDKIKDIIIVCSQEYYEVIDKMIGQYGISKKIIYAPAGATRQESVRSGLAFVNTTSVLIHEAARPFVKKEEFSKLIKSSASNVIIGSRIPYTVVKGNKYIEGLLERSELINVQLPQKFDTASLKKAHELACAEGKRFTEDGSLLFHYFPETKIKIVEGTEYNIKITMPLDMVASDIIYREYFQRRV